MKNFYFILLYILFTGCSSSKIINGRYHDPSSTFSVNAVSSPFNLKIHEASQEGYKSVIFTDDFGIQIGVEVLSIPEEFRSLVENSDVAFEIIDEVFKKGFEELLSRNPKTTLKHEENLCLDNIGPTRFSILSIPEGSHLADAITRERADCTRGYLISFSGSNLIINTYQGSLINEDFFSDKNRTNETLLNNSFEYTKNKLIKMRMSFRDEKI